MSKVIFRMSLLAIFVIGAVALADSNMDSTQGVARLEAQYESYLSAAQKNSADFPRESTIQSAYNEARSFADNADLALQLRSRASLLASGLVGLIADHYRSGISKKDPGIASFHYLQAAHHLDGQNVRAWVLYGKALLEFKKRGQIARSFIERSLKIKVSTEVKKTIEALSSFALDQDGSQVLAALQN